MATRDKASSDSGDILQAHRDLKGIFGINDDSALGALAAVKAAGLTGKIAIVGYDATPEARAAIANGDMYGDAIQYPAKIGSTTDRHHSRLLRRKETRAGREDRRWGLHAAPTRSNRRNRCRPLLEMRGIGKSFPGVRALDGVSLTLAAGEVLVLVGENGAGKSTLMKILAGALQADEGEILIDGTPRTHRFAARSPAARHRDDLSGVQARSAARPPLRTLRSATNRPAGVSSTRPQSVRGRRSSWTNSVYELPLDAPVSQLSVGEQQIVEIAKALAGAARIIVMDEPTAALTESRDRAPLR